MAKVRAPILSFGGSGQIGKTVVFGDWRGVKYAREYVVPANPQTTEQQVTRTTFAMLREAWKRLPVSGQAPWDSFALGRPFTGMNKFVGENLRVIRGNADLTGLIGSPGAQGGLAPALLVFAAGGASGEIDVTFTDPAAPTGWAIADHRVMATLDQDPALDFIGPWVIGNDVLADPTVTLTGLTAGADYAVTAWIVWTKPNGSTAYSVSEMDIVTATP